MAMDATTSIEETVTSLINSSLKYGAVFIRNSHTLSKAARDLFYS
jgi:hypothetical protein